MASLRKRYQDRAENPTADAPAVEATPQVAAAESSPVAAETPSPAEQPESPVEKAAEDALRQRLKEMEQAEVLQREIIVQQRMAEQQPPQPPSVEQVIAGYQLPESAKDWLRRHPEYVFDPAKNAQAQEAHRMAVEQTEAYSPPYFERMEHYLGLRQSSGNGQTRPEPTRVEAPVQRQPQRPVQRQSAPVSAPPTREAPSMSSGRPLRGRQPLTQEQREMARYAGVSEEKYAEELEKMNRLKAAGAIQDGG